MCLLTHSLSPVLVLVVAMGSMELKTSRSHAHSLILSHQVCLESICFSLALSQLKTKISHANSLTLSRCVFVFDVFSLSVPMSYV